MSSAALLHRASSPSSGPRLDEILHQVLAELNREIPATLVLTETKWPAYPVRPQFGEVVRAGLLLLIDMAGTADARLDLRAQIASDGGLKLRFSLFLPEPAGGKSRAHDLRPFEMLRQWGGDFRLEIRYPYVCLGLRLPPVVLAAAATA